MTPVEFNTSRYTMVGAIVVLLIAWMNIAFATAAVGCAALQICAFNEDSVLYVARGLQVVLYGAAGTFLLLPSRKPAARALGLVLLTISSAFAQGAVLRTQIWLEPPAAVALLLSARADAFLPFATCLLAMRFPEVHSQGPRLSRLATFATAAMFVLGIVLLVTNLSSTRLMIDGVVSAYGVVAAGYWTILLGCTLASVVLILLKARYTTATERARLRLLTTHLTVVASAMTAFVVLEQLAIDRGETFANDELHDLLMPVLQLLVLSLPLVATYALLVERAVDETVRVRNAVGYRLASATLAFGAAVPFVLVAWYLWNLRTQTINDAFTGPNLVALIGVALLGLLLFRLRTSAHVAVDRAFVRTTYDAAAVLAELHDRIARAPDIEQFAAHLCGVVTELGFAKATLMVPSDHNGASPAGALERMPTARFATLVEHADPPDIRFPWHLAIRRDNGSTLAILELEAKRREAPLTQQDRELLVALALQIARPLAQLLGGRENDVDAPPARECADCGAVLDESASTCGKCDGTELETSYLPKRLQQRFTVIRRLGTGSMGVVYEADDETLRRRVALKTLPRIADDRVAQLKQEAQAMARVSHPNVATVYQLEMWRGVPVVVMELFERGTFAKTAANEPVSLIALKRFGSGLADGLAYLHSLGLVHADVKPSNLGIATSGIAKIMDFGLSRLVGTTLTLDGAAPSAPDESFFAGTPAYLAPELVRGETPSPGSDVWALAVSLFEIYTGVNPFRRATVADTMRAIIRDPVPTAGAIRGDAPEAVGAFFACCLNRQSAERPASAEDFRVRLVAV